MFIKAPGKTDSRQRIKASYDGFRETVYERSPLKLHTSRGSATRLVTHSHTRAPSLIYFFHDDGCGLLLRLNPATVKNAQEVGTRTILVNATCGNVTRSAPLVVTIQ